MADTKISALTNASALTGAEELAGVQSSSSVAISANQLAVYAAGPAFILLASDYTLTSTTSAQKLFNTSTNGALTIGTGLFQFETMFQITGMSATSGNGVFSFAGTATLANPRLIHAVGLDNTTQPTGAAQGGAFVQGGTTFTTNTVTAATGTAVGIEIRGIFACTSGGTLIPSFGLTTAAAAAVKAGSHFIIRKIGESSDTSRGSWS